MNELVFCIEKSFSISVYQSGWGRETVQGVADLTLFWKKYNIWINLVFRNDVKSPRGRERDLFC